MSALKEKLNEKIGEIKRDRSSMDKVRRWINGYFGKIINFKSEKESFHIVFKEEEIEVRDGYYPSVEVSYYGDEETLLKVLEKKLSASLGAKTGELSVFGNLNEAQMFESLL